MLKIQEMLQQQPLPPAETQIELSKAAHLAHLIEPFKEMETPVVWRNTENDKIRIKHWLEAEVEDDFFDVGKLKKSVLNLPYQEAKYNGTYPCRCRRRGKPNLRGHLPTPCRGRCRCPDRRGRDHKYNRRGTRISWYLLLSYLLK